MSKFVEYIAGEGDLQTGVWKDLREFRLELEPGEFTLIWASIIVRTKALEEAEKIFPGYRHPEPFNIGGRKKIVEIGSALPVLKGPLLATCNTPCDHPETIKMIQRGERTGYTWRLKEEAGLQAMTSIGWLCDVVKARQPPITQSTSDVSYEADLLPSNMQVKSEEATAGYNKKQITLMENTKAIMDRVLKDIPEVRTKWLDTTITIFGQNIFRTTSKIFTSLPDLEEEERKKFEELKEKAKEVTEAE